MGTGGATAPAPKRIRMASAGGGPRLTTHRYYFPEATMNTILSAALVLGLCGLAGAQGEKADPVGTWKCEY